MAKGDIFLVADNFRDLGVEVTVTIPTNKILNTNHELVMGAGLALAAKKRVPSLPLLFGSSIESGLGVHHIRSEGIGYLAAPTKNHWKDKSSWDNIEEAWDCISKWSEMDNDLILIPLLGAGLGGLPEKEVKQFIWERITDRMMLVIP